MGVADRETSSASMKGLAPTGLVTFVLEPGVDTEINLSISPFALSYELGLYAF